MTDLGNRYTIPYLRDVRARKAGDIEIHQLAIGRLQDEIDHIDAVLALLDGSRDPTAIAAKRGRARIKMFRAGDLGRLVIGALRQARKPMGTHEITAALGLIGEDRYGSRKLSARVRANLAYLTQQKRVKKIGRGRTAKWALANSLCRDKVSSLVA